MRLMSDTSFSDETDMKKFGRTFSTCKCRDISLG